MILTARPPLSAPGTCTAKMLQFAVSVNNDWHFGLLNDSVKISYRLLVFLVRIFSEV